VTDPVPATSAAAIRPPLPDAFGPARLGPLTVRNRIIKAATFEGRTSRNAVTDELVEFHRASAAGGVAVSTLAFCAVSRTGRGAPNEIVVRDEARVGLRRLADAIHDEGAAAGIQLGHAGPTASAIGAKGLSPSAVLSPMTMRRTRAADDRDLDAVTDDFATAARLAVDEGFDVIEVHAGHGYLLSSFLSPKMNKRADQWGGSLENRARFPRRVMTAVREAVGDRAAVIAKLNMDDGVPGGLWLDESVQVAVWLEQDGALDAIELTGGSTFQNPMYLFRGDAPVREMADTMPGPAKLGIRLVGNRFFHAYPYEEAYFLPSARQFRAAVSMPLILLGGISERATVELAMREGFEFVAMARALLREPDLLVRWRDDPAGTSRCVHCNKCMPTIYTGTRCVLV